MYKRTALVCLLLPSAAYANLTIPDTIKPPIGHQAYLSAHAKGDQIYLCTLKDGGYAWSIQAPDAKLFDGQGHIIGNHYKGPIWEYKEGSRVRGKIINRLEVNPKAGIPWLLVEIIEHKGEGMFSDISYVNRINTEGGLAPTSGCDGNHLGSEKRVPYSADYVFYKAN